MPDALPDKLHLGCGLTTPPGWLNVDGSLNARLAKRPGVRRLLSRLGLVSARTAAIPWSTEVAIHDVRKALPWPGGSFAALYASHLLEHLYSDQARALLRECFRVLRPGGVIRLVVPDLADIVEQYRSGGGRRWLPADQPHTRADELLFRLLMRDPSPPRENPVLRVYRALNDFHSHKWNYDEASLCARLEEAGFAQCARRGYLQSRIEGIDQVESRERVEDGGLCVEAVKPGGAGGATGTTRSSGAAPPPARPSP